MNKQNLTREFKDKKLDVMISFAQQTRLWFSKIDTSAGYLFIDKKLINSTLLIDARYIEYAQKSAENVNVLLLKKSTLEAFIKEKKAQYQTIGIESEYITFEQQQLLKKWFPRATLVPLKATQLRIIKTPEEWKKIQKAGKIALKALSKVKPLIKPGVSEKDIDAELEKHIRLLGGQKGSFDAIVASGVRGAMPHGRASDKVLNAGEFVTIDFGAIYQGYCSDITRTFHVGKVTDKTLIKIEKVLKRAQKLGINAVKPGVNTNTIDQICRDYISKHGYGKNFVHSTGHGLGIDVHELPVVSANKNYGTILREGMVITVEPGIYIENFGGIRIEDDVLVTHDGHKVLSR